MRLAFVVQRYGVEVSGGAELHCRELAERLVARPEVRSVAVITTCAKSHATWANEYEVGAETIAGVRVERFPALFPRLRRAQWTLSQVALHGPRLRALEYPWIVAQGPYAPDIPRRVAELRDHVDAFIFFTYLYYPTVAGLEVAPERSILVPTAHDERALRMRLFRRVFGLPRAFAFNTPEERALVLDRFGVSAPSEIVGCGVELPDISPSAGEPARSAPGRPFLLYLGRIEDRKGVPELIDAFQALRREHASTRFISERGEYRGRDLQLVLAGRAETPLTRADGVVEAGFVSGAEKAGLLRSCEALAMPSRFESLSIVLLEAWSYARPALVEGDCAVTAGQTSRSGGGLIFRGRSGFVEKAARLLSDAESRRSLGAAGRRFVEERYSWGSVLDTLLDLVSRAVAPR